MNYFCRALAATRTDVAGQCDCTAGLCFAVDGPKALDTSLEVVGPRASLRLAELEAEIERLMALAEDNHRIIWELTKKCTITSGMIERAANEIRKHAYAGYNQEWLNKIAEAVLRAAWEKE